MHRRQTPAEDYRKAHMNPQVLSQKSLIKPLNQGLKESDEPVSKTPSRASYPIDPKELFKKLQNYKREQEKQLENKQFAQNLNSKLNSAQPRLAADAQPDGSEKEQYIRSLSNAINSRLPRGDVDVQSILDQHVSSVFSPRHTPGSTSPKNLQRSHYRSNEMSSSVPDFGKIQTIQIDLFSVVLHCITFSYLYINVQPCHRYGIRVRFQRMHRLD